MNKFPRSAYVHIPFCHRRCFYCDFAVIPLGNNVETLKGYGSKTVQEYLQFLYKEILSIEHKSPLSTIYVGGGTPSILDPAQIKELIDLFKENYGIDYGAEITMEVDPASFTQDDLFGFINAGINRFSLGVQSFNNQILQKSGRRHLKELRDLYGRRLVINPTKYEGNGVDEKLLKITEDMTGTLITADYNLSQIAEVKELKVMNLSDLVIALRPEVQPGESLNIKIVREGKEKMQGIGYLDDGTMVVIDEAKNFVGSRLDIVITGALQTPTGRMVFGKLINNPESNKSFKSPATQG